MHLLEEFEPWPGAEGWQLSNPPILSMAPLQVSLAIFDEVGMEALRRKSVALTGYLEQLLDGMAGDHHEVLTPRDPEQRGCQLSVRFRGNADRIRDKLEESAVICDLRKPDVVRVAPTPLYNSFHDVWTFAKVFEESLNE